MAALSKPEESIDEKYEACLKRLGQSKLGFQIESFNHSETQIHNFLSISNFKNILEP